MSSPYDYPNHSATDPVRPAATPDIAASIEALHQEVIGLKAQLIQAALHHDLCLPFKADGEIVQFVDATQLARYIPRTPETFIDWAKRGIIPASRVPGSETRGTSRKRKGGKGSWLFNLPEVKRALTRLR